MNEEKTNPVIPSQPLTVLNSNNEMDIKMEAANQLTETYDKLQRLIESTIMIPNDEFPVGREVEIDVEFTIIPSKFNARIRR